MTCVDDDAPPPFTGLILSDARSHTSFTGFDPSTGSAPDWFKIVGTGGFCFNDLVVRITTSGGGSGVCYSLTVETTHETRTVGISGNNSTGVTTSAMNYNNGSTIFFKVAKTCGTSVRERVSYQVEFLQA
jgi:hypothetical protein